MDHQSLVRKPNLVLSNEKNLSSCGFVDCHSNRLVKIKESEKIDK